MIMESHKYSYEEDISDEQDLTFKFFTKSLEENGINLSTRLMNSLGLKSKSGNFTNLAFLLSDQSDIVVKLAEYDSEMNFKIKKTFKGSLIKILNDVEEQVERLNDIKVIIDGNSFKRIETKSYPGAAIREIVMNAFCHANYFIRSNIKIEFFPDKAKITSPGGIFNASLENIMSGIQTYRNPRLVHIFDKLGLIENFGTGIPRTFYSYKDYEMQPEFNVSDNFFVVTLPNVNYQSDSINDLGLDILKYIKEKPGINAPTLTTLLTGKYPSITLYQVKNEIRRNLNNYIEHKGSKKTGGYHLK